MLGAAQFQMPIEAAPVLAAAGENEAVDTSSPSDGDYSAHTDISCSLL